MAKPMPAAFADAQSIVPCPSETSTPSTVALAHCCSASDVVPVASGLPGAALHAARSEASAIHPIRITRRALLGPCREEITGRKGGREVFLSGFLPSSLPPCDLSSRPTASVAAVRERTGWDTSSLPGGRGPA